MGFKGCAGPAKPAPPIRSVDHENRLAGGDGPQAISNALVANGKGRVTICHLLSAISYQHALEFRRLGLHLRRVRLAGAALGQQDLQPLVDLTA